MASSAWTTSWPAPDLLQDFLGIFKKYDRDDPKIVSVDYSLSRTVWKVLQKSVHIALSLKAVHASPICQVELSPICLLMPNLDEQICWF